MKKYIIYSLIITLTCGLGACNNDEGVDKANSIFSTEEVERSPFDNWILGNYTHPYNIALKYRMEDNESDMTHVLAPADYKKSVVLAKIIKHVWLEAYDEATVIRTSYVNTSPRPFTLSALLPMKTMAPWYWERQKVV